MSERIIEAQVVEERIVACPQCGQRIRLYRRSAAGLFKCGACRAALPNPFAAPKSAASVRNIGIAAGAVIALLVVIVAIGSKSSWPSTADKTTPVAGRGARLQTLSEGLPTVAPSVAPVIAAAPLAMPSISIPTEVPRNGILFDAYPGIAAEGEFTVINGSSRHAIAKVIDIAIDRKILSFGIQARGRTKITAIPDGTYNVIFAFGDRVYAGTDRFEKPRGFSKFDRPFTFATRTTATDTEDATYYRTTATSLEVTLTPVIGGNITTSSISQEEFERY